MYGQEINQNLSKSSYQKLKTKEREAEKNGGKGSVALVKNSKQSCCVFEDFEPPKSKSILLKGTTFLGPKRSVQFS